MDRYPRLKKAERAAVIAEFESIMQTCEGKNVGTFKILDDGDRTHSCEYLVDTKLGAAKCHASVGNGCLHIAFAFESALSDMQRGEFPFGQWPPSLMSSGTRKFNGTAVPDAGQCRLLLQQFARTVAFLRAVGGEFELQARHLAAADLVDLEGDKFADPKHDNPAFEWEYQEVNHVKLETTGCVAVGFEGFDVVGFPVDHVLKVER